MTDEEKKTGIMTDPEQDKAIFGLTAELRVTNTELKNTNESIKTLVGCISSQSTEINDIKKDISKIYRILAKHGVWIYIVSSIIIAVLIKYFNGK